MDIDIKGMAKAKTFKKIRKNYKSSEEFEKAFEETWNDLMSIGKKKVDGKPTE